MKLVASQPRQSTVHNKTGWCPHQNAFLTVQQPGLSSIHQIRFPDDSGRPHPSLVARPRGFPQQLMAQRTSPLPPLIWAGGKCTDWNARTAWLSNM